MSPFGSELFGGLGSLWGEFEVAGTFRLCNRAIAKTQTALGATSALIASDKSFTGLTQFCAAHTNLGFVNFFIGAEARARSMTAKVLMLEELN